MAITVALIEDKTQTLRELEILLRQRDDLHLVASCRSAEEAIERLPALAPAVLVVDILLPGASGIECVRTLRPVLPDAQFLMLTVVEDYEDIFQAILAGATGYLLKGSGGLERLADAIAELHGGGSPISTSIARRVLEAFQHSARVASATDDLTKREKQILHLIARGRTNKELAVELNLSPDTVRTHVQHIYKKLQVHTREEAACRVRFPLKWDLPRWLARRR